MKEKALYCCLFCRISHVGNIYVWSHFYYWKTTCAGTVWEPTTCVCTSGQHVPQHADRDGEPVCHYQVGRPECHEVKHSQNITLSSLNVWHSSLADFHWQMWLFSVLIFIGKFDYSFLFCSAPIFTDKRNFVLFI